MTKSLSAMSSTILWLQTHSSAICGVSMIVDVCRWTTRSRTTKNTASWTKAAILPTRTLWKTSTETFTTYCGENTPLKYQTLLCNKVFLNANGFQSLSWHKSSFFSFNLILRKLLPDDRLHKSESFQLKALFCSVKCFFIPSKLFFLMDGNIILKVFKINCFLLSFKLNVTAATWNFGKF